MTFDREPFLFWAGLQHWSLVFGAFLGVVFAATVLISLGVHGVSGPVAVMAHVRQGLHDLLGMSLRRVGALAWLTMMEAVRRKALLVFVIFAVLMMFAGWFLDSDLRSDLQVKNAVSFALTTASWLTIPVVLLLSCWGLPEDIRLRSIHTVVTKPVRRSEIVMGRVLGYCAVSAGIVALMGIVGFQWVKRQLKHLPDVEMICRVPVYGTLKFLDREGNLADKGVNTGDIWEFRSYIEGGTRAAAQYKFAVGSPVDQIKLESRFEAFRTHKGRIGQSLLVRYVLVHPGKELRVPLDSFEIKEFSLNEHVIDRKISYYDEQKNEKRTLDLFDDIVDDGHLTIEVQCLDSGQYLGMARPDFFIRLPDRSFAVGYFKAVFGIWLLTVFVISIGVAASTFVKGPVATLLAFSVLLIGQGFREFMIKLVTGVQKGGGPIESWYRLVKQMNDTLELPDTIGVRIMQGIDNVMFGGLWLMQHVIPDLSPFSDMAAYVANGFDVPVNISIFRGLAITVGYLIPCLLVGYYSLTLRELEAK
jgi:ABC-type transport system involved in multi-copper enzyme maturation permease subunit